jgi:RNA polymerase sigma-54 factor
MNMRFNLGQHMQQKQLQTLSPRMILSMKILQMPMTELQDQIEQELIENPVLEMQDSDPALPDEAQESPVSGADVDEREMVVAEDGKNEDDFERLLNLDSEVPEYFDERPRSSSNRIEDESSRQHDLVSNIAERTETLQDFLLHQLGELEISPQLDLMCERIISALAPEDGGYLRVSLRDLLPPGADEEDLKLAEEALKIVQGMEPRGIAARDLQECLLLQLDSSLPMAEQVRALVTNHLEDLRDNRLPQIRKATGYSIEDIQKAWDELRKLNPRPASSFSSRTAQPVTPEIKVDLDATGNYVVKVDDAPGRGLYISKYYRKRLANGQATPEERDFIKQKIMAAQWLIDSIEQRRNTISRVAQEIVNHQKAFFEKGPRFIQPLKRQEIADKVGVHLTTVSRAVDDKWIDTPSGIFPLRKFFVGGTTNETGEDVTWDEIRIKLQEIVAAEDKADPLSDDELVKRLAAEGFPVARRTVAKYRDLLGIPSSRQRRDWTKK